MVQNGMDEATLSGDNLIYELTEDGEIKNYTLNATDYGFETWRPIVILKAVHLKKI